MWFLFALGSSVFAALTSILAKIGIDGVNSTLATAIRTIVVLLMSWGMVSDQYPGRNDRNQPEKLDIFNFVGCCNRRLMALLL